MRSHPVRIIAIALALFVLCTAFAWAEDSEPTLYYYEARGQNLLAADPGSQGDPAFMIFPDTSHFGGELCRELGELLVPGEPGPRMEIIKAFQTALREQYGVATRVSGTFSTNTVQQVRAAAERMKITNQFGPVRVINLNKALQHPAGVGALRMFLKLTTLADSGVKELTDEQLAQCRPTMERNLNDFIERGKSRLLRGRVRGLFGFVECSEDRSDTDGDGLFDIDEVNLYGTDPKAADTDGDGLSDGEEVRLQRVGLKLDPLKADSDGDGLSDKEEMDLRTANTMVDPGKLDTDNDGLTDKEELELNIDGRKFNPTDPHTFDADKTDAEVYQEYLSRGDQCGFGIFFLYLVVIAAIGLVGYSIWQRRRPRKLAQQYHLPKQVIQEVAIPMPVAEEKSDETDYADEAAGEEEYPDEEDFEKETQAPPEEDEIVIIDEDEEAQPTEEIVGVADVDFNVDLQSVANRLARMEAILSQHTPPGAISAGASLAAINERLDSMDNVQAQTYAENDVVALRDRLTLMEKSVSDVAQKVEGLEQMTVRSMSEWGRQLSEMEERINRLIRDKG